MYYYILLKINDTLWRTTSWDVVPRVPDTTSSERSRGRGEEDVTRRQIPVICIGYWLLAVVATRVVRFTLFFCYAISGPLLFSYSQVVSAFIACCASELCLWSLDSAWLLVGDRSALLQRPLSCSTLPVTLLPLQVAGTGGKAHTCSLSAACCLAFDVRLLCEMMCTWGST